MSKKTKELFNSNVLKWSESLEDQLKAWHKIGNEEEMLNCQELMASPYKTIMKFSPIDKCKKLITFNSKINA